MGRALATGISATKAGFLEALSQTSELLGPMAYHEYEGIVVDSEESVRLIANMGDSNVVRNGSLDPSAPQLLISSRGR